MIKICNKIIEYSFYALFLLVPLVLSSATSELFELNKMWLTWALTIIIAAAWLIKIILQRKFLFQRTPLDIPIALFLVSQIISTIFSLDFHVSLWGYYSRFNGGLLSIISYIFLYYAFLSNFSVISSRFSVFGSKSIGSSVYQPDKLKTGKLESDNRQLKTDNRIDAVKMVKRLLSISLISGLIVALWGLPSHFGYDPTCFLFRGTLDVSCWTADFMPTVRIFSTLGQPAWLAAYLAILIPIAIVYAISNKQKEISSIKDFILIAYPLFLVSLFYVDLLFTKARSGILGVWISLVFFAAAYLWIQRKNLKSLIINPLSLIIGLLLLITFIIGTPFSQLNNFTLPGLKTHFEKIKEPPVAEKPKVQDQSPQMVSGGTESGNIRLNVWAGAINAWKANPIFGTGVETFAFAYYKYKPAGQNSTSEWNFLYNKAHNEYLNYLATTGLFGLGTYLLMIGYFLFFALKKISKSEFLISNQIPNSKSQLGQLEIRSIRNLSLALLAAYVSILVTNFFGFSVVMTNIYLFMIPAFVFILTSQLPNNPSTQNKPIIQPSVWQWTPIFFILVTSCFLLIALFRFWLADIAFALGYNLDRAGEYQKAYPNLHKAVNLRGDEPVFKDELSVNNAIIAAGLLAQQLPDDQKERTISVASSLATEAINTSNEIVSKFPNNAVFWKTRTRLFYTLSQVDSRYLPRALDAIEKASLLAPNDANILYNLGVLYGQNDDVQKGISAMEKTIQLKPDYRDAHYALGLFYHTASLDPQGKVVANDVLNQKAISQMQYILKYLSPNDAAALGSLKSWGE